MAERESKKMKKDTASMETEQKLLELQSFLSEAMNSLHHVEGVSYKTLVDPLVAIEVSVLRKRIQSLEEIVANSNSGDIPVKGMNYAILEDKMDNMTKQHDSIVQGYLRKLDAKDKKIMELSTELAKSKVVIEELQSTNKKLSEENYFFASKKQDKK